MTKECNDCPVPHTICEELECLMCLDCPHGDRVVCLDCGAIIGIHACPGRPGEQELSCTRAPKKVTRGPCRRAITDRPPRS